MTFRQSTAAAALSDGECSDDDDNNRDDDDNGPSPRQRPRLQPSSASANAAATTSGDASSKKFSVWTDMVIDQDLSDKLDSGVSFKICIYTMTTCYIGCGSTRSESCQSRC